MAAGGFTLGAFKHYEKSYYSPCHYEKTESEMNLKHLYYFWQAARHGGVAKAGEQIHITPQTLSGQIKLLEDHFGARLFARKGRNLELTEAGRLALGYAEEIFALGAELDEAMRALPGGLPREFRVGVADALPKPLAYRLLRPVMAMPDKVRVICREWRLDRLLAELALHRLDMVLADTPAPANIDVRVYSHRLGRSGIRFLARADLAARAMRPFPECLAELPLLVPGEDSAMRHRLDEWLVRRRIHVNIAGEFDDAALLAAFGGEGVGVFPVASVLADHHLASGALVALGEAEQVRIEYYALSAQRRVTHPCVLAVKNAAELGLARATE